MLASNNSFSAIQPNINYHVGDFSANVAAGYLGGESNEYVYDESGRTLSQLNWKIDGAAIIKGEVEFDLLTWLTANVNGWTTLDKGHAQMDDYDWMNPARSTWTDWSHHPDTDLNYANNIDLNLRAWFLQNQHYKLGGMAGYQQNSFEFLAKGGCYQYAEGLYTGCFPDHEPGIRYQQTFETTYVGLAGKYLLNNVELNATFKISPWVQARDVDEHYARDITFTENGENSTFTSVTLAAGYFVSPHTKVFFETAYNQFANGKADTQINDHRGIIYQVDDSSGLSNHNYVLALGVQYTH